MDDELDFEQLVRKHSDALYRFGFSLVGNEHDASDLLQQTFYLWAKKGHQLVDRSKVKTWLFTTLHREFLGRQRHRTKFPHQEVSEVESELPEMPPVLPTHLDWQLLTDSLNEMDPVYRAAVSLFYLEDYSYIEIAEVLGVPLGTVKSRISRGIAQLQQLLFKRIGSGRTIAQ